MKRNIIAASILFAIAGFSSFSAMADAPMVIKFSHVVKADTPKGKAADKFKELAEKYTEKKVKVEVYPNSTLFNDDTEMKAVINGDVEIIAPSLAKMNSVGIKEFQALDTPFIFDKISDASFVLDGPIGKNLLKKMEEKDLYGMAFWDNGFKQMHANKPLRTPSDAEGLRMRIQPSKVIAAQMRAAGAIPRPMSFSELSTALRHGLVDGSENPASNFYTQGLVNFQKHVTMTNHGYLGYVVVSNKNWWDGLPKDIKPALEKAMIEATVYERSIAEEDNTNAIELIKATGKTRVNVVSEGDRALWKAATEKSADALDPESKKVVAEIREAMKTKK